MDTEGWDFRRSDYRNVLDDTLHRKGIIILNISFPTSDTSAERYVAANRPRRSSSSSSSAPTKTLSFSWRSSKPLPWPTDKPQTTERRTSRTDSVCPVWFLSKAMPERDESIREERGSGGGALSTEYTHSGPRVVAGWPMKSWSFLPLLARSLAHRQH